jgi:hypothetical protein
MQRWASALSLGKMREPQALPVLLSMLTECFPPEEKPAFEGDGLWIYNDWRRNVILVLRYFPQQDVVSALLNALQAYWRLEQAIPEEIESARITWRWTQEFVMYTLGLLDRFDVLPEMVEALEIVQPKLSRWRVSLVLGWLHADAVFPRVLGDRAILREPAMSEQIKAVLQERFDLSPEEKDVEIRGEKEAKGRISKGKMDYNYEGILSRYRMNYVQRAEGTAPGGVERRTYEFVVKLLDGALINPSEEKTFQLILLLMKLATGSNPPETRAIYRECGLDLNRDTGQEPWQF